MTAFLGLGSNLGKREEMLREALERLNRREGIQIDRVSDIYETDPVGYTDQPPFLNLVCKIRTALSPHELLDTVLEIERELGRERLIRWGPRTVDIDVLLYGSEHIDTPDLSVPHPRLMERAFVLVPLADVANERELLWRPELAEAIRQIRAKGTSLTGVRIWTKISWQEEFELSGN